MAPALLGSAVGEQRGPCVVTTLNDDLVLRRDSTTEVIGRTDCRAARRTFCRELMPGLDQSSGVTVQPVAGVRRLQNSSLAADCLAQLQSRSVPQLARGGSANGIERYATSARNGRHAFIRPMAQPDALGSPDGDVRPYPDRLISRDDVNTSDGLHELANQVTESLWSLDFGSLRTLRDGLPFELQKTIENVLHERHIVSWVANDIGGLSSLGGCALLLRRSRSPAALAA